MNEEYKCPICGATNPKYFGVKKGHIYCRRCISFRGEEVIGDPYYPKTAPIYLDYDLSEDQKRLSNQILENYKNNINTLVHAVCGSGKTEIVLEVIKYAIRCGERVGFAIPRRDVVIEIHERLSTIFKRNKVVALYGGHTNDIQGDLIILTTHQLYRYYQYFDLLIMDEIDAFPFNGNEVLESFFLRATRGRYVLMSATPPINVINNFSHEGFQIVELFSRFHTYPLPIPKLYTSNSVFLFMKLLDFLKRYIKNNKPVMVFVPTIEMAESLYIKLGLFYSKGCVIHSKKKDRKRIIKDFKNHKYIYVVTTAVLERGVTFKDAQVIVYKADHNIYSEHTLIQISGRVGRKIDAPDGEVIFLANKRTKAIDNAISEIERANKNLQNLL